jgi:hypothetical protein
MRLWVSANHDLQARGCYSIASLLEEFCPLATGHHHHADLIAARFSLLRLSVAERLMGAGVVLAALWLAVWWAL